MNIQPIVKIKKEKEGDFSSDNSDADVDIEYVKKITKHYGLELIVYGMPITFTVRKRDEGKDIIDIYLSTINKFPDQNNH